MKEGACGWDKHAQRVSVCAGLTALTTSMLSCLPPLTLIRAAAHQRQQLPSRLHAPWGQLPCRVVLPCAGLAAPVSCWVLLPTRINQAPEVWALPQPSPASSPAGLAAFVPLLLMLQGPPPTPLSHSTMYPLPRTGAPGVQPALPGQRLHVWRQARWHLVSCSPASWWPCSTWHCGGRHVTGSCHSLPRPLTALTSRPRPEPLTGSCCSWQCQSSSGAFERQHPAGAVIIARGGRRTTTL